MVPRFCWAQPYVQRAIADHLDIETHRIDALISEKRRMIELPEKRPTSLAATLASGTLRPAGSHTRLHL